MRLKRDNWTNDEVIALLKLQMMPYEGFEAENDGIMSCVNRFHDLKAEPATCSSAMALDLDTMLTVCVGCKLPQ